MPFSRKKRRKYFVNARYYFPKNVCNFMGILRYFYFIVHFVKIKTIMIMIVIFVMIIIMIIINVTIMIIQ